MSPERQRAHDQLTAQAQTARDEACEMMSSGSREYDKIRELVESYINNQYAADVISEQTDTGFGDLPK